MKRYIKIIYTFLIAFLLIVGTVACSKTSKKENNMTQGEIEQLKEEIKSELKEEIKSELKKEMKTETPVAEQPRSVESAPPVTEQPRTEQPSTEQSTQSNKTEHTYTPENNPPIIENEENFPERWGVQRPVVE